MRVLALAAAAGVLAGCGGPESCPEISGCARVERAGHACVCAEWQTVSTETVALPFVVIRLTYPPVGSASILRYGATWDPSMFPPSSSSHGSTVRSVVRRPDGSERIAKIGTVAAGLPLRRISETELRVFPDGGVWTLSAGPDVAAPGRDVISVWTNPAVSLVTNAIGEQTVDWSAGPNCFIPVMVCPAGEPLSLSAASLAGSAGVDVYGAAFLSSLAPADRAALLAFDPRAAGGAAVLPRYQLAIADAPVDSTVDALDAAWQPCSGGGFEVLAETAVPLASGDTFVLQYGVQSDGTCAAQRPGLLVGTATPGCSGHARVLVDRLTGTLLMEPSSTAPACTGP